MKKKCVKKLPSKNRRVVRLDDRKVKRSDTFTPINKPDSRDINNLCGYCGDPVPNGEGWYTPHKKILLCKGCKPKVIGV